MKILPEAPAMAMGNLFWIWAKYIGDVRTQESMEHIAEDLLNLPKHDSSPGHDGAGLFAAAPTESFDWSDGGGSEGRNGGHRGSSHDTQDDAGVTTALSLFTAFGHGDFNL